MNDHIGVRHVDVAMIATLEPSAQPPPGLSGWPAPGDVYASPALVAADPDGDVVNQYGSLVGLITEDGLSNPAERLLYVGVSADAVEAEARSAFWTVSGFGGTPRVDTMGDVAQQPMMSRFVPPYLALLVLPALFLLVIAIRLGGERRDRHVRILDVIGASRSQRSREVTRAVVGSASLGAAVGVGLALLGTTGNWTVPGTGYVIVGGDIRPFMWALVTGGAAAVGLVVLASVYLYRSRRGSRPGTTRPAADTLKPTSWPVLLLPAMVLLANAAYVFLAPSSPYLGLLAYMVATIGAVICMPAFVTALTLLTSKTAVWLGRHLRAPSALVAGRTLRSSARPVVRAVMIGAVSMVLVTQVTTFTSATSEQYRRAQAVYDVINQSLVTVSLEDTPGWLTDFVSRLPSGAVFLRSAGDIPTGRTILWGTCEDLRAVFGDCPGSPRPIPEVALPRGPSLRSLLGADTTYVEADPSEADPASVDPRFVDSSEMIRPLALVVATTEDPVDEREVRTLLNGLTPAPPSVDVGETLPWLIGAEIARSQTRWVGLFGTVGLLFCLVAALLGLGLEFFEVGRRLAPVSLVTGARSTYITCAVVIVGIPIVLAGAVGVSVGWAAALAPTAPGELASLPGGVLAAMGLGAVALAALFVPFCVAAFRTRAALWSGRDVV